MKNLQIVFLTLFSFFMLSAGVSVTEEIPQYRDFEPLFEGPAVSPGDSQVRDVDGGFRLYDLGPCI